MSLFAELRDAWKASVYRSETTGDGQNECHIQGGVIDALDKFMEPCISPDASQGFQKDVAAIVGEDWDDSRALWLVSKAVDKQPAIREELLAFLKEWKELHAY